ncbi:MAG: peptidylprolyl isomerase [Ramlibacter sp.]|nr:peptidylprolyl isomerase [Ramlibacter sp.]
METAAPPVASVNGVPLHAQGAAPPAEELRQRACTELLRQAAIRDGMLAADDPAPVDGAISEAAARAIDRWLESGIEVPQPSDEACRRHHAATAARYRCGERVLLRHILFAVTPGVDVAALRRRAEDCLLQVRCHDGASEAFGKAARELSNCPSAADGGELGWLAPSDTAPEMAREIFGHAEIGVLPRLVHSRFGFHVVEVIARDKGTDRPYEDVREAVVLSLRQHAWVTALRQLLQVLAGAAVLEGVDLEQAATPLVQ